MLSPAMLILWDVTKNPIVSENSIITELFDNAMKFSFVQPNPALSVWGSVYKITWRFSVEYSMLTKEHIILL